MNYRTVLTKSREIAKSINMPQNFTHAVVRIEGRIRYFDERQFRALQLAVTKMTDEEYEDFRNTVVIYNGPTVRKSTGFVEITRDGYLDTPFQEGFLDYCGSLSRALLMIQD